METGLEMGLLEQFKEQGEDEHIGRNMPSTNSAEFYHCKNNDYLICNMDQC